MINSLQRETGSASRDDRQSRQDMQDGLIFILLILPTLSILHILFSSMNASCQEFYHANALAL